MINRIPPIVFGIAYIGSIFLFAIIYNSMPFEFYHTTSKFETTFITDKEEIYKEISSIIKYNFKKSHQSDSIIYKEYVLNIDSVKFYGLDITNENLFLRAQFRFNNNYYFPTTLKIEPSFHQPDTISNNDFREIYFADTSVYTRFPIPIDTIFNGDNLQIHGFHTYPRNIPGIVVFPDSLNAKIDAYLYGLDGFPSYSSGNFERMFYLSTVTITTLGFGDIVPITPKTRLLISIEAIWGIILIGLFLNSLANKITSGIK